ncbi:hypothetical protein [Mycolicibacterium sp. P1-18]|uniref:hypothetical protein n=1 Tax=Mycolicibacterium sp. P1-18 TaxID=2024615 RepID=UPI0011F22494|nr:hypothetical protein [Mycolicibacterium sp. P1-18]
MLNVLAAGAAPPPPTWSTVVLALAGVWWVAFFVASFRATTLRVERRLYWLGHGGAAVLAALAVSHRGWPAVVGVTGLVTFVALLYAVLNTPYLKIGDRLITASESDRRRDERDRGIDPRPAALENYSTSTPGAFWWILAALTALSAISFALPARDGSADWRSWVGPVLIAVMAPGVGVLDGRGASPWRAGNGSRPHWRCWRPSRSTACPSSSTPRGTSSVGGCPSATASLTAAPAGTRSATASAHRSRRGDVTAVR